MLFTLAGFRLDRGRLSGGFSRRFWSHFLSRFLHLDPSGQVADLIHKTIQHTHLEDFRTHRILNHRQDIDREGNIDASQIPTRQPDQIIPAGQSFGRQVEHGRTIRGAFKTIVQGEGDRASLEVAGHNLEQRSADHFVRRVPGATILGRAVAARRQLGFGFSIPRVSELDELNKVSASGRTEAIEGVAISRQADAHVLEDLAIGRQGEVDLPF